MAGPTVTLTFASESDKLEKTFGEVGKSAKGMSTEVDRSSKSFSAAADSADTVDTRAMGFRDTITGLQDGFRGLSDDSLPLGERLLMLGMGVGDLASGFANFLIPSLQRAVSWLAQTRVGTLAVAAAQRVAAVAASAWASAQRVLNFVLSSNPIAKVIVIVTALAAAFVMLWRGSETVRRVVGEAFQWIWNKVRQVTRFIVNATRPVWQPIVEGVQWAVRQVKGALQAIVNAAQWAVRQVKAAWSSITGLSDSGNRKIDQFFRDAGIPRPRTMHTGGTVPGAPGEETLALLQAGEKVTPAGQTGKTVTLRSDGSAFSDLIMSTLRNAVRREGGDVQLVLGAG